MALFNAHHHVLPSNIDGCNLSLAMSSTARTICHHLVCTFLAHMCSYSLRLQTVVILRGHWTMSRPQGPIGGGPQQQLWRYTCTECGQHLRLEEPIVAGSYVLGDRLPIPIELQVEEITRPGLTRRHGRLSTVKVTGLRCSRAPQCGSTTMELTGNRWYETVAWYDVTFATALLRYGVRHESATVPLTAPPPPPQRANLGPDSSVPIGAPPGPEPSYDATLFQNRWYDSTVPIGAPPPQRANIGSMPRSTGPMPPGGPEPSEPLPEQTSSKSGPAVKPMPPPPPPPPPRRATDTPDPTTNCRRSVIAHTHSWTPSPEAVIVNQVDVDADDNQVDVDVSTDAEDAQDQDWTGQPLRWPVGEEFSTMMASAASGSVSGGAGGSMDLQPPRWPQSPSTMDLQPPTACPTTPTGVDPRPRPSSQIEPSFPTNTRPTRRLTPLFRPSQRLVAPAPLLNRPTRRPGVDPRPPAQESWSSDEQDPVRAQEQEDDEERTSSEEEQRPRPSKAPRVDGDDEA